MITFFAIIIKFNNKKLKGTHIECTIKKQVNCYQVGDTVLTWELYNTGPLVHISPTNTAGTI
jgi:hypothetical protein